MSIRGRVGFVGIPEVRELAVVAGEVVVGVLDGDAADAGDFARRLVGIAVEQELRLDGLVEGRFLPDLTPRRHDDQHEHDHRQQAHDDEDRGADSEREERVHPDQYRPRRDASAVILAAGTCAGPRDEAVPPGGGPRNTGC